MKRIDRISECASIDRVHAHTLQPARLIFICMDRKKKTISEYMFRVRSLCHSRLSLFFRTSNRFIDTVHVWCRFSCRGYTNACCLFKINFYYARHKWAHRIRYINDPSQEYRHTWKRENKFWQMTSENSFHWRIFLFLQTKVFLEAKILFASRDFLDTIQTKKTFCHKRIFFID